MAEENLQSNGTPEQPVEVGTAVVPDVDPAIAANAAAAKEADKPQAELPLEQAAEAAPQLETVIQPGEIPSWARKKLKETNTEKKELERKLAEAAAELEVLRATQRAANPEVETARAAYVPPQDNDAAIREAAKKLRAEEKYNEEVEKVGAAGKKAYGTEWDKSLENLLTLGGDGSLTVEVMQGILATDDPAHVLLELGKNPDNYQRIMELPPARRQTEMVKIAMQTTAKPRVSSAPAPVDPVGGRQSPSAGLRDDMSDDEWNAAQDARDRQRWEQRKSRRLGA